MNGEKIRQLRTDRGLSQSALGERLGVSPTAVYKWERGIAEPDVATLTRLAAIFGVTVDALVGYAAPGEPTFADDPATVANITVMARAFRQMTPEEQERFINVGRALFDRAFGDGKGGERP